jgi:putative membrane protein
MHPETKPYGTARTITFLSCRRAAGLALGLTLTVGGGVACGSATATQPAAVSAQHLSATDSSWLDAAHQANQAEIQVGEHAETNTTTAAIQAAGKALVRDHSALDVTLIHLADQLGFNLVGHLTDQQIETEEQLSNERGPTFDSDFVGAMMTAHQQMITATETEIQHGSSPEVIALAQQALPTLKQHLEMLRAAASSA